jgi:hypothetical protein
MILTVVAVRTSRTFAAFVFVFGVWDLFYYLWLRVLMGWPRSWLEWDVLFLIPVVWLGPWICPVLISLLFIAWGFWTLRSATNIPSPRSLTLLRGWPIASFLQPAAAVFIDGGIAELSQYTPGSFWWWLFVPSYLLMTCGGKLFSADKFQPPERSLNLAIESMDARIKVHTCLHLGWRLTDRRDALMLVRIKRPSQRLSLRRPQHRRRPGVMPCDDCRFVSRFVSAVHCCSACWSHTN